MDGYYTRQSLPASHTPRAGEERSPLSGKEWRRGRRHELKRLSAQMWARGKEDEVRPHSLRVGVVGRRLHV